MRQRLALARAYAVQPEFLLMDEPFGALDAQTRGAMQDLLLQVLASEGKTVLLITHSVDEAIYLSSRIVVVTARPARVREVIDVPFGYPRDESVHEDPRFAALRAQIRALVMQEYEAQARQSSACRLDEPLTHRGPRARPTQETTMTLRRRTLVQAGAAAAAASLAGFATGAFAQATHQGARRLPAHAGGRRPDLARPGGRHLGQARPGPGVHPVHHRASRSSRP